MMIFISHYIILPRSPAPDYHIVSIADPGVIQLGALYPTYDPVVVRPVGAIPARANVSLEYAVRASAPTFGEHLYVEAAKVSYGVLWGTSKDPAAAVPCVSAGPWFDCLIQVPLMFSNAQGARWMTRNRIGFHVTEL